MKRERAIECLTGAQLADLSAQIVRCQGTLRTVADRPRFRGNAGGYSGLRRNAVAP
jgi:hypothetical protein